MEISIIIPILNEAKNIGNLIQHLKKYATASLAEIIVVDGGSKDESVAIAQKMGVLVLQSPKPGRAVQMNYGATKATGDILYFVHADTLPPEDFCSDILQAVSEGYELGCFRFKFDSSRWILKVNAYFTRFDRIWCRGGDQTLFILRTAFEALEGYDEHYIIMEEHDFILRANEQYQFKIIPNYAIVSPRKYDHNSYLRVQLTHLVVFNMFRFGYPQERIVQTYKRFLNF